MCKTKLIIFNLIISSNIPENEENYLFLQFCNLEGCDRESATSIKHLYVTVIALNLSDMGGLQDNRVFTQKHFSFACWSLAAKMCMHVCI